MDPKLSTKEKGDVAEQFVIAACLKKGWMVLKPIGDCKRYDIVLDRGNGFERVQVKSGKRKGRKLEFSTTSSGYNFVQGKRVLFRRTYVGQIDLFATYDPQTDKVYLIPCGKHTASVSLRLEPTKNKQSKNVNWAEDYEVR